MTENYYLKLSTFLQIQLIINKADM